MAVLPPEAPVLLPGVLPGSRVGVRPSWWRRARRSADVWVPAGALLLLVFFCFIWPLVYPVPKPIDANILQANLPILSRGHILGTDPLGDDIMSRLLYGGRLSLEVGLGSNLIGLVIGGGIGMVAGYQGGLVDATIMRVLDVLIAFPSLVLVLAVAEYLGPGELNVIWALSFFSVPAFARLSRSAMLRLREQGFVLAARLSGTGTTRMLARHAVPNVAPQLLTFSCLGIAVAIILEAALSFLGLGIRPPAPTWGDMISLGETYLTTNPNLVLVPSIALFLTAACFNLLGDALRRRWASR